MFTHDDVPGVFVSTNVRVFDDQCAFEVPQHARGDITGELGGRLWFRHVAGVFLFFLFCVEIHLGGCCGGRFRWGKNVVEVVVVEVGVDRPVTVFQGVNEFCDARTC